ncbi:MAG: DNA alkylation repair protein [Bacteroidales bacterium]|nr:DNA alkylation repair protein [Bacteroidales bacterium]MDD4712962.1 DNA alkylation repair protein [Bacteroidales bacterium]
MLRLRMNGVASTAMRNSGLNYKLNYGLDAMSLRDIARQFEPNAALAEHLWGENARECKILATLLFPKTAFTSEKADLWLKDCFVPELMEQLCFNLLQHLDYAPEKTMEWINNEAPEIRTAGYTLLLRLIIGKKSLPELSSAIQLAEKDLFSNNFRLQQSAERFLERAKIV